MPKKKCLYNAVCLRPDGGMSLYCIKDEAEHGISLKTMHMVMEYEAHFEIIPNDMKCSESPLPTVYGDENALVHGHYLTLWRPFLRDLGYACSNTLSGNLIMVPPADNEDEHRDFISPDIVKRLRSECAKLAAFRVAQPRQWHTHVSIDRH